MASPARIARPVVTYQRSRPGSSTNTGTGAGTGAGTGTKTSTRTLDELLDPEAALHAKIASALQDPSPNGNENRLAANALRRLEDDFDSAYLETEVTLQREWPLLTANCMSGSVGKCKENA
jgi:hypothetical protein